jgi:hypothetical protein
MGKDPCSVSRDRSVGEEVGGRGGGPFWSLARDGIGKVIQPVLEERG